MAEAGLVLAVVLLGARVRAVRPAVAYLCARKALDLVSKALVLLVLAPSRARMREAGIDPAAVPFSAPLDLAAVYLDGAVWLAGVPAALIALCVGAFTARPRRWLSLLFVVWFCASVAVAAAYPATRGALLAKVYLAALAASFVCSLACIVPWAASEPDPNASHGVALVAVAVLGAELLAPDGAWARGDPFVVGQAQGAHLLLYLVSFLLTVSEASCSAQQSR